MIHCTDCTDCTDLVAGREGSGGMYRQPKEPVERLYKHFSGDPDTEPRQLAAGPSLPNRFRVSVPFGHLAVKFCKRFHGRGVSPSAGGAGTRKLVPLICGMERARL